MALRGVQNVADDPSPFTVFSGRLDQARPPMSNPPVTPSKEQIAALPPFNRIELSHIVLVASSEQLQQAVDELMNARVVGFDTESKPTFVRGEVSDGPHVVQFSTLERAYVFQLQQTECHPAVSALLAARHVTKVGFGLSSDRRQMVDRLGVQLEEVLDLDSVFRKKGYRNSVGVKSAVAMVLNMRFSKSHKITTSNWASSALSDAQLLYAANDAYAAVRVYSALGLAPVA